MFGIFDHKKRYYFSSQVLNKFNAYFSSIIINFFRSLFFSRIKKEENEKERERRKERKRNLLFDIISPELLK